MAPEDKNRQGNYSSVGPNDPAGVTDMAPVQSYASVITQPYDPSSLEQPLEVHEAAPLQQTLQESPARLNFSAFFSKRKAVIVSTLITLFVLIFTLGAMSLLVRHAPKEKQQNAQATEQKDVKIEGAIASDLPKELQGTEQSLLIKGDVVTRGSLKVSDNGFVTIIRVQNPTANQTVSLPNSSGTICLDSNNCNYASQASVNALQGDTGSLQSQIADLQNKLANLSQITIPPAGVTDLNGQKGSVSLQGSLNRVVVNTTNGVVTLSTPQDLDANANVQFGNLTLGTAGQLKANTLIQTAAGNTVSINAGNDMITFVAGGRVFQLPNSGGASQTICTTGASCASGGGTAVLLAPGSAQNDGTADASVFINDTGGGNLVTLQSGGVDKFTISSTGNTTIGGSLTISTLGSGFVKSTSGTLNVVSAISLTTDVTGTLPIANGGTNATTAASARSNLGAAASGTNADITSTTALNTITPSAALTIGSTGQQFTLQGASNSSISAGSGANITTVGFAAPSGLNTITFPAASGTVCLSSGNCTTAGAAGGDLTGTYPNPTIAKLQGSNLNIVSAANGQILVYNGATSRWENASVSGDISLSGTGVATIANSAVTSAKIADGTITGTDIASGTVTNGNLQNSSVTLNAGNGLITGGAVSLGGNVTLNVGAGDGITVAADTVAVDATVCRTTGNCAGAGAGVTASTPGAANRLAVFTAGQDITSSWLLQNGSSLDLDSGKNLNLINGNVTAGGTVQGTQLISTVTTGTSPITVASSTLVTNFNADLLDGQHGAYYQDASNLNAGTVASARITGAYNGLTGSTTLATVGTITSGTWQGSVIADAYIQDNITISNLGTVDWTALNNYPAACPAGQAITQLGDTITCTSFAAGSGSGNYIQNTTSNQNSANFNVQSTAVGSVTAKFRVLGSQTADVIQIRDSGDTTTLFSVSPTGAVAAVSFTGDGSGLTNLNGSNVATGTVANARLVNSGALTVTAGNGLSGGGSVALGASTNLAVVYGSTANTAVQGNTAITITAGTGLTGGGSITLGAGGSSTLSVAYGNTAGTAVEGNKTLTCASGTGNLTGGGNIVTLGSGGTCNNLTITNSPIFSGTLAVQGATTTIGASGQQGSLLLYDGGAGVAANTGTVQVIGTLGQDTTFILPDPGAASATICLSTGNCAGAGGGVTSPGGTTGKIAKFTGSNTIADSTLSESGSTVTASGNVIIQGSNSLSLGTSSSLDGSVKFYNAAGSHTVTLQAPASDPAANLTFKLPSAYGANGDCLLSNGAGVLSFAACPGGGGGGVTSLNSQTGAVTISNASGSAGVITIDDATTAAKGIASFSSTNFSVTSGGVSIKAGGVGSTEITDGSVTGTDIATATVTGGNIANNTVTNGNLVNSSVTVTAGTNLTNGGAVSLGGSVTLNVVNNPTFSGLVTANGGLTVATGQTFTTNGDAFTDLTGDGLQVSSGALGVDSTVCRTTGNCAGVGGGITGSGTNGQVAYFNGSGTITSSANLLFNGTNLTVGGTVTGSQLISTVATGTAPVTVSSTTLVSNFNADLLDGQHGAFYQDAGNLNAGVVASARISGSYTGITGVGTITAGTWNGSQIADAYLQDNITISNLGSVDWTALTNYPAACSAGQAVTQLGDTITCAAFAAGSGSGNYIQNQFASAQSSASFWISGNGRVGTNLTVDGNTTMTGTLTLTGNTTANRPSSPTEGTMYYDTTTKQILTYSNGKWQADRGDALYVAASDSSQTDKDRADYQADGDTVAAGDGDQIQINAALTAASGKKVILLAGTYTIDATISVPNNITLSGVGYGTLITIPNSVNATMNGITLGSNDTVRDLRLDGNKTNQASGSMYGIMMNGSNGNVVTNVRSMNWTTGGMYLGNSSDNKITNSIIQNNGSYGIQFNGVDPVVSMRNLISGNTIDNNATGISIFSDDDPVYNLISNNNIQNNATQGIYFNHTVSNTIANNTLYNNGTSDGIVVSNSTSNTITGNNITGNTTSINLTGSFNNYLADNIISGSISNSSGNTMGGQTYGGTGANYVIQPAAAATIELRGNTNITGSLTASANVDFEGSLTVGNANQFVISNLGVVTSGTWQGTAITDTYIADTLTVNSSSTVDWQALNNYPAACAAGNAITQLGDTITCSAFAAGSGSGNYIQNQFAGAQSSASFWISGSARVGTDLTVDGNTTMTGTLRLVGNTTANRPVSPSEGTVYYDTTLKQLLTYSNGKWQSDRSSVTKIVASGGFSGCSGSVPVASASPEGADYVTNSCTSAQTAINSAISALPASGGTVYLMEGTYIIDGAISISSNVRLVGAGHGTIIKLKDGINASIDAIDNVSGAKASVMITNLKLDGNKANNSSGTQRGIDGSSIGSSTSPGLTVRDVYIENFRNQGLYVVGGAKTVVSHNFITLNGAEGIHLNGSIGSSITDNEVRGNTATGGITSTGSGTTVANNKVLSNTGYGISLTGDRSTATGNTIESNTQQGLIMSGSNGSITGNTVYASGSIGIYLNVAVVSTTVSGNTVINSGTNGIEVYNNSTSNTISGNTVANSGTSTASSSGIILNANCDNTSVIGNRITDTAGTGYAIEITGPTNDTVNAYLSDNTYSGTGATSINDQGTNTIYGGQLNSSGNFIIQPTGTIELMKNTNVTGTLNVSSNLDTNGSLNVGTADQFIVSNAGVVTSGTWQGSAVGVLYGGTGATTSQGAINNISQLTTNGDLLYFNGTNSTRLARGNNGECLLANTTTILWGACTPTTLQGSYNGSSPATIDLSNNKDLTINATEQTVDSSIVFNLQCSTCSANGGRFAVQDAGTDVFTVNPNGDIVIGSATNGVTFSAAAGYKSTASGTARNTKVIRLAAEYPSVVLDAGSGSNNTGTMTSGFDLASRMNYYKWTTTQVANQSYDIVTQVPIPSDFGAWASNPLSISSYTSNTTNGTITLEARDSTGSVICNFVAVTPGSTTTWTANTTACTLGSGTYTPGDYMTLRIRIQSPTSGDVRVGNITLSYLSKF